MAQKCVRMVYHNNESPSERTIARTSTMAITDAMMRFLFAVLLGLLLFFDDIFILLRYFMIFFPIFVIILATFAVLRSRASKKNAETISEYLKKESDANFSRKKDISNLDYIVIPLDSLPIGAHPEVDFSQFEDVITDLSTKQILNLNGISNTDLKIMYGAANLNALSEFDNNYTTLITTLANYGEALINAGFTDDGVKVLEYCANIGADIVKVYKLLKEHCEDCKIASLRERAELLNSIRKTAILEALDEVVVDAQA